MAADGIPFSGVLYAGLMLTAQGPKLIEYNARFGDPETQVLMMRFEGDLIATMLAVAEGRLADLPPARFSDATALTVRLDGRGPDGPAPNVVEIAVEHSQDPAGDISVIIDAVPVPGWTRVSSTTGGLGQPISVALPPAGGAQRILVREFEQLRLDFLQRRVGTDAAPEALVAQWLADNAARVGQFRAVVDRARHAAQPSAAMLAQVAGQARVLLGR